MKQHPLRWFFLLTFGITWGLSAIALLFPNLAPNIFGDLGPGNPAYHIAVYAPAIAAFTVIGVSQGQQGVVRFLRRFLHWNVNVKWYLLAFLGIPAAYFVARVLSHRWAGTPLAYPIEPWYAALPIALSMFVLNPGAMEEIGWRGYALPLLQRHLSALEASIGLGLMWGLWRLPVFFVGVAWYEGASLAFLIGAFFLETIALSVLMTFVYNGTGGSLPLAMLTHWAINDPFGFREHPEDELIYLGILVAAALVTIWAWGPETLGPRRETQVIPQDHT
ncbi:MAG: CPBP family intramembrane metalloprotease [Anaerolineae bacterium]|nr:CPBP family intramembrane metalloprotease [Anaerolineae bacterium]